MARSDHEGEPTRRQLSGDVAPTQATYLAVAEAKGCDPLELPPLGRTIDAAALDGLVGSTAFDGGASLSFEYAGCSVTIADGEVRVADR